MPDSGVSNAFGFCTPNRRVSVVLPGAEASKRGCTSLSNERASSLSTFFPISKNKERG